MNGSGFVNKAAIRVTLGTSILNDKPLKILIVGGDSLIGGAIASYYRKRGECVIPTTRRKTHAQGGWINLDLKAAMETDQWPELPDADIWIICAAITRMSSCREDQATSRIVNVDAPVELARQAELNGVMVIIGLMRR